MSPTRRVTQAIGCERPIDFAVFGLFLGVILVHITASAIILASDAIAALLGTSSDVDFWLTMLVLLPLSAVSLYFILKPLEPNPPSEEHELTPIPVERFPKLIFTITLVGKLSLLFVLVRILVELPAKLLEGSVDILLFLARMSSLDVGGTLVERFFAIELYLMFFIYVSAFFFYERSKKWRNASTQSNALDAEA